MIPVVITVFDWDDTLLPSTYIENVCITGVVHAAHSDLLKREMDPLSIHVQRVIEFALTKGKVYIVTNSTDGWVSQSVDAYMPSLKPLLEKVTIISAHHLHSATYPNDYTRWKEEVFSDIVADIDTTVYDILNIHFVSIGDSTTERDALILCASRSIDDIVTKNIKLIEKLIPDNLIKQLTALFSIFPFVYDHPRSLDLQFNNEVRTNDAAALESLMRL